MKFKINTKKENGNIVFSIVGRLDTPSAERLRAVLIPAFDEASSIELDFAQVNHISSMVLSVLIDAEKTSMAKGVPMTISNVSDVIMRVLKITKLDEKLTIR